MGEVISKNKYLDFNGLEKYDKLIKSYIALANKSLANASDVSALQIDVAALKAIDHNAYISADKELETSIKEYINGEMNLKQDVIEDLDAIRSGAAKGATALQDVPDEYITEGELADKEYTTTTQVENLITKKVCVKEGLIKAIESKKDLISNDIETLTPLYVRKSQAEEGR
jgi:hypothetical protein